jgi:integrase
MTRAKSSSAVLLTDAAVSKLRPDKKRRRVRDLGSQALFLIIAPSGRKSWQMRFRRPGGKIGKVTLGPVSTAGEIAGEPTIGMPLTLRGARQLAAEVHRQRSLSRDVIADQRAERHRRRAEIEVHQRESFAASARRYVEEHARKRLRSWRDRAKRLGLSYPPEGGEPEKIKGGLAERWQDRPLREIDDHDIWSVVEEAKRIGSPGFGVRNEGHSENRARHLRSALSALFSWAHRQRLVEDNPCRKVAAPTLPSSRDRVLTNDEVRFFWQACQGIGAFEASLKIMLLTGQRRSEVAGMRWDELNEQGEWHLPKERTKNKLPHIVPLSRTALELIERQPRIGPHVFTTTGTTPISGWSKAKRKLDARMEKLALKEQGKDFKLKPWGLHDLRRTAVTRMNELRIRPDVIEQVVNHVSGSRSGVAGIYNRSTLLPERRDALKRWEAHVLGVVVVQARPANIVTLKDTGGRRDRR